MVEFWEHIFFNVKRVEVGKMSEVFWAKLYVKWVVVFSSFYWLWELKKTMIWWCPLVYRLVPIRCLLRYNWLAPLFKNLSIPQMVFIYFASTNQLPGFSKSGTLPAPNMRTLPASMWTLIIIFNPDCEQKVN